MINVPPTWKLRDTQRFAIEKILNAFERKPVVAVQAPTGTGKSLIGRTVANHFESSYLLTPLKSLQDQYWSDFKKTGLTLLKGKKSYYCNLTQELAAQKVTVADSFCQNEIKREQIKECKEEGACPYYNALNDARESNCTIMNFMGYLVWRRLSTMMPEPYFLERDLHVVDEAHRIEDTCRDQLTINVREDDLFRNLGMQLQPGKTYSKKELAEYFEMVGISNRTYLNELMRRYGVDRATLEIMSDESEVIAKEARFTLDLERKFEELEKGGEYGYGVEEFFDRKTRKQVKKLVAKPINVGGFIRSWVLGRRTLMMSATLPKDYVLNMGIRESDIEYIEIDSPFDKKNRPIFLTPVGRMNFRTMPELLKEKVPDKISKIIALFPDTKGIIHMPSYDASEKIYEALKVVPEYESRLILQTRNEELGASHFLEMHATSTKPTILISPAMKEGVDLKDDLSRFQIIVKCPFPNLQDPAVARLVEINPAWYDARTLMDFMQMYGRSIRSEEDWAKTYILDDNLIIFLKRYARKTPKYITEAIHWRS